MGHIEKVEKGGTCSMYFWPSLVEKYTYKVLGQGLSTLLLEPQLLFPVPGRAVSDKKEKCASSQPQDQGSKDPMSHL